MREAAEALRLTAQDLHKLGVCDQIVTEPVGGAHRDSQSAIKAVGAFLTKELAALEGKKPQALRKERRKKYLDLGSQGLAA